VGLFKNRMPAAVNASQRAERESARAPEPVASAHGASPTQRTSGDAEDRSFRRGATVMDRVEARRILGAALDVYRSRSFAELAALAGESRQGEVLSPCGVRYQVEIQVFWDDRHEKNLRVLGSIDDGGLTAFVPLSDSFIVAPDGKFVGE
jgi:hypothetical protein